MKKSRIYPAYVNMFQAWEDLKVAWVNECIQYSFFKGVLLFKKKKFGKR